MYTAIQANQPCLLGWSCDAVYCGIWKEMVEEEEELWLEPKRTEC